MADTQRRSRPLKPTLRLQAGVSIRLALSKQSVIARIAHTGRLKKVSVRMKTYDLHKAKCHLKGFQTAFVCYAYDYALF